MFGDFDILLVEGLKNLPLPRISIFRNEIDYEYIPYMNALAIDESINPEHEEIPTSVDLLDLNNTDQVIDWVLKNAKEV
jgi:molybdopterin-guanine dinucleotide biosynthesis protein B